MDDNELPEEVWIDPNESIPADIPTTWAFVVLDRLGNEKTIWIEAEFQSEAQTLLETSSLIVGMTVQSSHRYSPDNLAVHLRWLSGVGDTNLYAIRKGDKEI